MQTIVTENKTFFGQNKRPFNPIGEAYYKADKLTKQKFIDVAKTRIEKLGGDATNLGRTFRDVHSKVNITKVPVAFFHSAHLVFGMSFPLSVSERKIVKQEMFSAGGKDFILTVAEL
jgi:hypothetical protein